MVQKLIYLDNNATTKIDKRVLDFINENIDLYGNASSMHSFGRESKAALDWSRDTIARVLDCSSDGIIFTSGASEANNTLFNSFVDLKYAKRKKILISSIEHPSILEVAKYYKKKGVLIQEVQVNQYGQVTVDELKKHLDDNTLLVSIMAANNEIGTINDIKALAKASHEAGALFHTDATQIIGREEFKIREMNLDFVSISAHKVYGPKGMGALIMNTKHKINPLIKGGHQEDGRRAGTYNLGSIMGMAKAIEIAENMRESERERLLKLKTRLKDGLFNSIDNVVLNGHPEIALTNTLNLSFPSAEGESILLYLDFEGIAVSTGSACASGDLEPSYVLLACGLDIELAHGSVRFSLGRETTEEDIDKVIKVLPPIIKRLREMSTR